MTSRWPSLREKRDYGHSYVELTVHSASMLQLNCTNISSSLMSLNASLFHRPDVPKDAHSRAETKK